MPNKKSQPANSVAFVCMHHSASVMPYASRLDFRQVTCIGQVGMGDILNAFSSGVEQVLLIGCADDDCRHGIGPQNARSQVQLSQEIIALLGFDREQLVFISADSKGTIEQLKTIKLLENRSSLKPEEIIEKPLTQKLKFNPAGFVCIDCGRCSGICPVARTELGFSPRRLIRQALDNNSDVPARALYACLGCDLCTTVCPSGKGFAQTIMKLRAHAFNNGANPVLAHSGIMQTIFRIMAKNRHKQQRLDWLKPELRVGSNGETALFIGCLPYFDVLFRALGVQPLKTAENAIRIMNELGIEPVVLADERCCGHDLLWLGDIKSVRTLAEHNLKQLQDKGVKQVVFLCPECLRTFKIDYPAIVGETGLELVHITEFLINSGFNSKTAEQGKKKVVTFQDPCRLGRHLKIYDEPRQLLKGLQEIEIREMAHNREQALCCGGTSWLECGAAVKILQERRLNEAKATGAEVLVTACSKCEIHLRCALSKSENKDLRLTNIIDLLYEGK